MIHGKNEKEKAQLSPYVLLYVDCNAVFFTDSLPHSPQPWQSDKASFFLIKNVLKHGRDKKSDKASPRAATPSHMKSQV